MKPTPTLNPFQSNPKQPKTNPRETAGKNCLAVWNIVLTFRALQALLSFLKTKRPDLVFGCFFAFAVKTSRIFKTCNSAFNISFIAQAALAFLEFSYFVGVSPQVRRHYSQRWKPAEKMPNSQMRHRSRMCLCHVH